MVSLLLPGLTAWCTWKSQNEAVSGPYDRDEYSLPETASVGNHADNLFGSSASGVHMDNYFRMHLVASWSMVTYLVLDRWL